MFKVTAKKKTVNDAGNEMREKTVEYVEALDAQDIASRLKSGEIDSLTIRLVHKEKSPKHTSEAPPRIPAR